MWLNENRIQRKENMTGSSKESWQPLKTPFPIEGKYPTLLERRWYRLENTIYNSLYPVHPLCFASVVVAALAYHYQFHSNVVSYASSQYQSGLVDAAQAAMIAFATGYIPVFLIRCFLKHFYFSYKGFLFEDGRNPSITTRLWAICRRLISYTSSRLRSSDSLLPNLPLPSLQDTISRYLETVEPILSKEEFDEVSGLARGFLQKEGKKLQFLAWLYSCVTSNYVTNFWEKYAYLYSRECVLINSSVAHCDLFTECIAANQAVRAAHVVYIETLSMLAIDRQTFRRIGDGLLCACHYRKMYATTRIPGVRVDRLMSYGVSRHMVAYHKGNFYKVEMFDDSNRIRSIPELVKTFADILTRDEVAEHAEAHVAALTTDRRDRWCANRDRFFLSSETNKKTLETIESAIAFIVLDDSADYEYNAEKPERLDHFLKSMLTGDGKNRWADKSLNYCVSANGRCGGTTEHSIGDGVEFDHMLENFVYMDTRVLRNYYPAVVEEVRSPLLKEELSVSENVSKVEYGFKRAERLKFDINNEMEAEIERCYNAYKPKIDDLDLATTIFRTFGKGLIKKGKLSPDGFVQMAIQLANFKDQKKFVLTYESASARFYANSRTETLRTASKESCAFVKSMLDPNSNNEERYRLLQIACKNHVNRNRECMVGKGVDRHLFVLYVLSKAISVKSAFLNYFIAQPWLLSTSQAPTLTDQMEEDANADDSWLGAAFGPVAKNGYGICYRFAGNHSICIHISSLKSAENTDSHRFRKHLVESFVEMASLFEGLTESADSRS
uniref:Cyclic nucleotide-binding domain-containing protein n=1 Tax=Parascaris univalens TaxID=6257 RepID=A0A915BWG4_PARUN